jgi:GntR family transcriptional repressor for pyruvate dehydrogenase complex
LHRITPIAPYRTFEHVVEQIANSIQLGELQVGDRIPSERDLASGMQISRPSLREAIKILEDIGVIEVRRGLAPGMYVKSTNLPREMLRSGAEVRADEVRSILEARRMLETRVSHLAAVYATEEDFERMQATIDEQKAMLASGSIEEHADQFVVQDALFHIRMAGATHNPTVLDMARLLQGRLEFARDLVAHEDANREWVIDVHERRLVAIRLADHDRIETVMEEHIRELELAWERTTATSLVRPLPDFMLPHGPERTPPESLPAAD